MFIQCLCSIFHFVLTPFCVLGDLITMICSVSPLILVVIGLGIWWYYRTSPRLPENTPPFPVKPIPILGHLSMLKGADVREVFHEWRIDAGDIFKIYFGSQLVVVVNSYAILKEAFVKHADIFSDRYLPFMPRNTKDKEQGIVWNSGQNWKEQRSVSINILRKFGMGKNFLAEKISGEVEAYLQVLSDLKGEPTDVQVLTNTSTSNVICAILVGERFEYDDPYFIELLKLISSHVNLLGRIGMINSFDSLKHIPGDLFGAKQVMKNVKVIRTHFCRKFVKANKEAKEEDKVDNFINSYYDARKKKEEEGVPTTLDEENLLVVISNLFLAGTETTSTTILWAILYGIQNPSSQEKVYKEIYNVVGTERLPSIQDRPKMNYTNAYILEIQRMNSIVHISIPHLCNEDVEVAGYTIPKNTAILANLHEILHDVATWKDPLEFRPERFLDEDNNLIVPEEFIPFGIGRRFCMGEALAKMELFLYISGIFQCFQILPEDPDNLPPIASNLGATNVPKSFKPRFRDRREV